MRDSWDERGEKVEMGGDQHKLPAQATSTTITYLFGVIACHPRLRLELAVEVREQQNRARHAQPTNQRTVGKGVVEVARLEEKAS